MVYVVFSNHILGDIILLRFSFDAPMSHLLKISDLLPSSKSVNPINFLRQFLRIFIRCSCVASPENFGFTTFCHFVCEVRKSYRIIQFLCLLFAP